jgi:hypothetical protein
MTDPVGPIPEPAWRDESTEDVERLRASTRRRARIHFGLGGMFFAFGIAARALGLSILYTDDARDPALGFMAMGTSFNAVGLGMVGFGSSWLGRAHALEGRQPRLRPALGWTLFGTGLAVLVASRVAPMGCFTSTCAVATSEIGYYAGLASMSAGLGLATFSIGYRKQQRLSIRPDARLSPHGTHVGLALTGRF